MNKQQLMFKIMVMIVENQELLSRGKLVIHTSDMIKDLIRINGGYNDNSNYSKATNNQKVTLELNRDDVINLVKTTKINRECELVEQCIEFSGDYVWKTYFPEHISIDDLLEIYQVCK